MDDGLSGARTDGPPDDDGARLAEAFRAAMARLASGVSVVAVGRGPGRPGVRPGARAGGAGVEHAITVTSLASVSLDPPMVLFCVHRDARLREALDDVDTWSVSILDASAGPVADWLATPGRPALGALDRVAHRRGPVSGAALLEQAQAWLECRTAWIKAAGDHDVVVGEVLAAEVAPGARGGLVHRLGRVEPQR